MIRPIFGSGDIVTGIEQPDERIAVYPNPNNGNFYFDKDSRIVAIHDLIGREVSFTTKINDENQQVSINQPLSGVYLVRSMRNGKIRTQKFVVY